MIGPQFPEEAPGLVPDSMLRQFGGLCLAVFGGMFTLGWYRHDGHPSGLAWAGLVLAVLVGPLGLIYPAAIRPVYLLALAITRPIGAVVSVVLMGALYFGLLTPLALIFRLAGRDVLGLRRAPVTEDYWLPKSQPRDITQYLQQYQSGRVPRPAADRGTHP